jgi:hypothetical protein
MNTCFAKRTQSLLSSLGSSLWTEKCKTNPNIRIFNQKTKVS